jgi:hypothetical protein
MLNLICSSVEVENPVRLEKFSSSFKLFNFPVFRLGVYVWLDLVCVFSLYQRVHIHAPYTHTPTPTPIFWLYQNSVNFNILIFLKFRKFHSSNYIDTLLAVQFSELKFVYDNREIRNSTKIPEFRNNDTSRVQDT